MRNLFIVLLLCVWIYLAYGAFQAGRTGAAAIYLLIGVALTAFRLSRRRA